MLNSPNNLRLVFHVDTLSDNNEVLLQMKTYSASEYYKYIEENKYLKIRKYTTIEEY